MAEAAFPLDLSAAAETEFPYWVGGRAELLVTQHFAFSLGVGTTPVPYASSLGGTIATLGGNPVFQTLIEDMLASNFSWSMRIDYHEQPHRGWGFGLGANFVSSKGDMSAKQVLSALTNQNYGSAGAILHSTDTLFIGQIHGFYDFPLTDRMNLKVSLGILEILDVGIAFASDSAAFDRTNVAKVIYALTEQQLKNILFQYGISPFLGTELSFRF